MGGLGVGTGKKLKSSQSGRSDDGGVNIGEAVLCAYIKRPIEGWIKKKELDISGNEIQSDCEPECHYEPYWMCRMYLDCMTRGHTQASRRSGHAWRDIFFKPRCTCRLRRKKLKQSDNPRLPDRSRAIGQFEFRFCRLLCTCYLRIYEDAQSVGGQ